MKRYYVNPHSPDRYRFLRYALYLTGGAVGVLMVLRGISG